MIYYISRLLILLIFFSSCGIIIPNKRSWSFIQNTGGIKVDSIIRIQSNYTCYVNVNVSGLDSITIRPKTLNSGLACSKIYLKIDEKYAKILVSVGTKLSGIGYSYCRCRPEILKALENNEYDIYYKDIDDKEYFMQHIKMKE
jgi:hypothetical protein